MWSKPHPLGHGAATDVMATIAAPLLAGFSVATLGVVLASPDKFAWANLSVLLFALGAVFFVASMQFGFQAKMYLYSESDLRSWWGAEDYEKPGRADELSRKQGKDFLEWDSRAFLARHTYNLGIAVLACAVGFAIAPGACMQPGESTRWAAAAIVWFAGAMEIFWVLRGRPWKHRPEKWKR